MLTRESDLLFDFLIIISDRQMTFGSDRDSKRVYRFILLVLSSLSFWEELYGD
jgi:hypothetical protein